MSKRQNKRSIHSRARRHARLAVVPHADNQYRPHLIRRYGIVVILLFVIVAQFISNPSLTGHILGATSPVSSAELLAQTNARREVAGLTQLQLNDKLSQAAYYKAKDMFTNQYWSHTSPAGVQPWKWFSDTDYNYAYAGENLAKNFSSTQALMNAWMGSEKHKENILKPIYQDVGFATVEGTFQGEPTSIVVALYGTPAEGTVQGVQFAAATETPGDFVTQLGKKVQEAPPLVVGSTLLLFVAAFVATAAHSYRYKLPRALRGSWYRHHGAYKALGLFSLLIMIVALYSTGGQI